MTDDTRDDRAEPTLPPDEQPTWSPPEEVTTPVPAAPVALAGDRPPVRSRLRWGIALLVSLLVVVIAGGAFYLVTAATPTSALLADVPGDALYYVELRADLPGSQRQALAELLSGFPGFADRSQLDAKLSESVDKLLLRATDGKYDYSTQIKPWFAGQLAVAVPNLPASGNAASGVPTHLLVLATVTDAAKAGDWVKSVIGSTSSTTESYGGVSLSVVTKNEHSAAFGVKGQVLLVGDLDSVKASIDAECPCAEAKNHGRRVAARQRPGEACGELTSR